MKESWPNLEVEDVTPVGQMGWICPKCGGVFAPHMNYCMNCTQPKAPQITYATGIIETNLTPSSVNDGLNGVSTSQTKRADYQAWAEANNPISDALKYKSFKEQHGE